MLHNRVVFTVVKHKLCKKKECYIRRPRSIKTCPYFRVIERIFAL